MGRDRRRARLEDLDDGCLLEVRPHAMLACAAPRCSAGRITCRAPWRVQVLKHLTPLPDLFLAARVCRVRPA